MSGHAGKPLPLSYRLRKLLPVHPSQRGLVIKQVQMRRATALKQIDYAADLRRKMRIVQDTSPTFVWTGDRGSRYRIQQRSQGSRADAEAGLGQEMSSRTVVLKVAKLIHVGNWQL